MPSFASFPRPAAGLRHAVPVSRLLGFVDTRQLDERLTPLLPDAGDRAFVLRCLVGEGPMHHRGANYVLLSLLAEAVARLPARGAAGVAGASAGAIAVEARAEAAVEAAGQQAAAMAAEVVTVPMRLPPHLHAADAPCAAEAGAYPVGLPLAPLVGLAAGRASDVEAMVDCLTDGPPQHALANVLMVALLERLLAQLPPPDGAAETGA